ncbi:hypothetical protein [Levilactobacillus brevis]|uniref:hypothetical protein n=1 Tax=Levilactobacillus brevis TaxID=1580 RepID=UPI0030D0667D
MEEVRPGFLLKYIEKKYVSDFISKGTLHFSSLGYFIDLENTTGDNVIGDKSEGARSVNADPENTTLTISFDGKEYEFRGKADGVLGISYEFTDKTVREWGVLSMCNMDLFRDFEEVSYDKLTKTAKFKLKKSVGEELYRLSDGGNRVPILIDANGLIKTMDTAFKNGKHNVRMKNVSYYAEDGKENISLEEYKKDPANIVFLKRNIYEYQRETRIALLEPVPYEQGLNMSIGSLEKAAVDLQSHEKLMSMEFFVKVDKEES